MNQKKSYKLSDGKIKLADALLPGQYSWDCLGIIVAWNGRNFILYKHRALYSTFFSASFISVCTVLPSKAKTVEKVA